MCREIGCLGMLRNLIHILKKVAKGYAVIIILFLGGGLGFLGSLFLMLFGLPLLYIVLQLPFLLIGVNIRLPIPPEWLIEIIAWICAAIGAFAMYQNVFDDDNYY